MILTQSSLVDLLESAGHQTRTTLSNAEVQICCVYCNDNKYHCYLNPDKQLFICFKCGSKGHLKVLFDHIGIKGVLKLSLDQIAERISRISRLKKMRGGKEIPKKLRSARLPDGYIPLSKDMPSFIARRAWLWLKKRGLDWKDIRDYQIGFCRGGKFASHLILPVFDRKKKIKTFQSRAFIGVPKQKSLNPESPPDTVAKTDILYGVDKTRKTWPIVLVEGPFDVISLNRKLKDAGWPIRALALFGHTISKVQVHLLLALKPSCVWVMMDSDAVEDGRGIAKELAGWLEGGGVYHAALESGDPDDLSIRKLEKILANSQEVYSFQNHRFDTQGRLPNDRKSMGPKKQAFD